MYGCLHEWASVNKVPTSTQVTVSVSTSFSYTTGQSASETTTDSIRAGVEVLLQSLKAAIVTSTHYVLDVPYTATVTPEFTDGTNGMPYTFTGVYRGVQLNDIQVVYEADVPLSGTGIDLVVSSGTAPDSVHLLIFLISAVFIDLFVN